MVEPLLSMHDSGGSRNEGESSKYLLWEAIGRW